MKRGLNKEAIAMRAAKELRDGMYVNLGIGIPTMVSNFVFEGQDITFESENGVLGFGRIAEEGERHHNLVNAMGQPITLLPGASLFDSAIAFAMLRGGHVDVAILGAYQVSEKGDLANYATAKGRLGSIGGAMDIACGAKRIFIVMEHTTGSGELKILKECTMPLTAKRVVDTIFTDIAVIDVIPEGLLLREIAPTVTVNEVQAVTEPELIVNSDLKEMTL